MASINLSGILKDPTGEVAVGDQIRFTHRTTTGDTIKFARSVLIIPPGGDYDIDLEFGNILVEYLDIKDVNYKNLGIVTVNGDSTAVTLPELLLAIVPPTDEQLLEFQNILAEAEALVAIFATDEGAASVGSTVGSNVQQDLDALFSGQISGVVVFTTKALLDAFTPVTQDELTASYKVTNDPTSTSNGFYHWDGVSVFVKDADLVQNVIDENNTSDAVSGKAVFDHTEQELSEFREIGGGSFPGYTYVIIDSAGKILGGFDSDGNFRVSGGLALASQESGFPFALLDEDSKFIAGFTSDNALEFSKGAQVAPTDSERNGYVQAFTDSLGRIVAAFRDGGGLQLLNGSEIKPVVNDKNGYAHAFTDSVGRVLLGIRTDGKISITGVDDIEKLLSEIASPTKYKDVVTNVESSISSGPDIICWGDSLTQGAGSSGGLTYPFQLASKTNLAVRNAGVGGETSTTIMQRNGAVPFFINIHDNEATKEIPASTSEVEIQFEDYLGNSSDPMLQGNGGATDFAGVLNGVQGTIRWTFGGGQYLFKRDVAGSAVPMDRGPYPFRTDYSELRRGDILVMWLGTNGNTDSEVLEHVRNMINHARSLDVKYIIMTKPTGDDTVDDLFLHEFGRNVFSPRAYLSSPIFDGGGVTIISSYGLDDAGITPTAQDLIDIAAGVVPDSLRSDSVHFNNDGYEITAEQVHQRLLELKYI